ncbi:hypothetical protein E2320_014963 [Naja naja]|nr:hypothetical protein E2320_014963 [Naja naja]
MADEVDQAYDQHLNMILGDVEETVTTIEIDEETYEEIYKSTKRNIPMLFVRGDGVVLVAPPLRILMEVFDTMYKTAVYKLGLKTETIMVIQSHFGENKVIDSKIQNRIFWLKAMVVNNKIAEVFKIEGKDLLGAFEPLSLPLEIQNLVDVEVKLKDARLESSNNRKAEHSFTVQLSTHVTKPERRVQY